MVEAEQKFLKKTLSTAHNFDLESIQESQAPHDRRSISKRRNTVSHRTSVSPGVSAERNFYEDETYLRRLRQKNYGKWYIKPEDYGKKIELLNTELARIQEMKN